MSDLYVGDVVLDEQGEPHLVTLVHHHGQGVRRIYPTFLGPDKDIFMLGNWSLSGKSASEWARELSQP